jgi:uncharacterized protein YacL (UPF0231 family)
VDLKSTKQELNECRFNNRLLIEDCDLLRKQLKETEATKDIQNAKIQSMKNEFNNKCLQYSAKSIGESVAIEINSFRIFFEEEEPFKVVNEQGISMCTYERWLAFCKSSFTYIRFLHHWN